MIKNIIDREVYVYAACQLCLGVVPDAVRKSADLPIVPNYIAHPEFPHTAHDNYFEEGQSCATQKQIEAHPRLQTSQPAVDGRLYYVKYQI